MIRRMVTRLIVARLIPVAINAGKKAFRKKKPAAKATPHSRDVKDVPELDVVDETIG